MNEIEKAMALRIIQIMGAIAETHAQDLIADGPEIGEDATLLHAKEAPRVEGTGEFAGYAIHVVVAYSVSKETPETLAVIEGENITDQERFDAPQTRDAKLHDLFFKANHPGTGTKQ